MSGKGWQTKFIFVIVILLLPFVVMIYNARGYWIYPIQFTNSGGGVNYKDPSIDIDELNNMVYFSYTWDAIGDIHDEIYYGNNTIDILNGENEHILGMVDSYNHFSISDYYTNKENIELENA
ncbi:MAG: hypothetical protein ACTSRZ_10290, partial [Promethearchaeota archaeon]